MHLFRWEYYIVVSDNRVRVVINDRFNHHNRGPCLGTTRPAILRTMLPDRWIAWLGYRDRVCGEEDLQGNDADRGGPDETMGRLIVSDLNPTIDIRF